TVKAEELLSPAAIKMLDIIIVRAPGRINLMGRHVDHQNGLVNLIAIDKEIFITASIRKDYRLVAHNVDKVNFPDIKIDLSNLTSEICNNWLDVISNANFIQKYRSPKGKWDNYLKAAYLRLINLFGLDKIYGANICVSGNILIALPTVQYLILSHLKQVGSSYSITFFFSLDIFSLTKL
ncbi:unnamed protein product, partial [marine sediment metagenome]